jgi:hypothetical protein
LAAGEIALSVLICPRPLRFFALVGHPDATFIWRLAQEFRP